MTSIRKVINNLKVKYSNSLKKYRDVAKILNFLKIFGRRI